MCKCQGNPLARVTLALVLPYLLVSRASAESIDSSVASLRTLAKTCNYSSLLDGLIRDKILVGIKALVNEDTLLPMMFLGPRKLGNICCGHKCF